ncbi:MAG: hypothetical protein ACK45H_13435 [Bacteroidota bacterium]|jgi:hypothetical protein
MNRIISLLAIVSFLVSCDGNPTAFDPLGGQEDSSIQLGEINYEGLSEETQLEIGGAGCGFSKTVEGASIFMNGLMLINGVYEMLQPVETNDSETLLYVNKNWEFELQVENTVDEEGGSAMDGTATVKSRTSDQVITLKVFGQCGC